MEEEMHRETPREEINAENAEHPERQAKHEQLTCATTEEDFNRQDSSLPPVEARCLAGGACILEDCRTVGHVMVNIAMARNMIAGRVVVVDPESGRKVEAADQAVPVVHYVIIDEQDAAGDIDSTICYLSLHAQQGDIETCFQLMKLLGEPDNSMFATPSAAESLLSEVISRRDAEWETSVKTLMQVGVHGGPAFLAAASAADSKGMTFILSTQAAHVREARVADLVEYCDNIGDTSLKLAAGNGHTHIVEKLLAAGANTERSGLLGDTALIRAACQGHEDVVSILVASGANVKHADLDGNTALIGAARKGCKGAVAKLVASGANVEHENSDGDTALMVASREGHAGSVGEFLAAGAKLESANEDGDTALTLASSTGCWCISRVERYPREPMQRRGNSHHDVVVKLLAAGANVEHEGFEGYTALMNAACLGHAGVLKELLAAGAKVNHACSNGTSALIVAAACGCNDDVIKLLAAGANVNHANSMGITALSRATSKGHADVIAELLAAGAGIEQRN